MDASYNHMIDIPNDVFRFLSHLRIVDLSNNQLRTLPDNLFREEGTIILHTRLIPHINLFRLGETGCVS